MSTIVHFEIPSDNLERTRKFYTELFGWKMEKMPGPMEYWMFSTTTNDEGRSSSSDGEQQRMISGGMMKR
jgi:predicted enzyme related to lactoylglutathione lyase